MKNKNATTTGETMFECFTDGFKEIFVRSSTFIRLPFVIFGEGERIMRNHHVEEKGGKSFQYGDNDSAPQFRLMLSALFAEMNTPASRIDKSLLE